MTVLFLVLATRDVNPEVLAVGGLDEGLVEVRVGDQELKPAVEDVLIRVGFVVAPLCVSGLGDLDVGSFTECVPTGVCTTDLDVELATSVTRADDNRLLSESSERFKTLFAKLLERWNEL